MPQNIQLSPNFWLSELVKSQTAERLGIDNWPQDQSIIDNLTTTVNQVLQPIRDHYGVPLTPNSGYRCLPLNRAIGSHDNSQHTTGQAVDVEVPGVANHDLAMWVKDNLDYDQLILEFYYPGEPTSGWVHVSYVSPEQNRKELLTINKNGTFSGLLD